MTLEEQEQQLRELIKQYIDEKSITKLPQGWLIKPKRGISPVSLVLMSQKLKDLGATYSANTNTFTLKEMPFKDRKEATRFARIPLGDLVPGYQPRLNVDLDIEELYDDMKVNGQKERIIVRPSPKFEGKYEVLKGNRRKRCAELLLNDKNSHLTGQR